jgi:hypothetical protein
VVKWYTSTGLVLAFWGFIIDFIMGTLLVIAISTVQSIKRALDNLSHRYRNRAYMAFAAWTFLLVSVIALAVLHALLPSIYNTIHINSIVNLLVEVLNTLHLLPPLYEAMSSTDCEILRASIPILDAINCCENPAINCIEVEGEMRVAQIIEYKTTSRVSCKQINIV